MNSKIDIAGAGYPAVRAAFNDTLQLCIGKLSKLDIELAEDILELGALDEDTPGVMEMLTDTALYSRKGKPTARTTRRAIDRIAPKLSVKHDPLKAAIAARLPAAIYSIFKAESAKGRGLVQMRDLLDNDRAVTVMDNALAAMVAKKGEMLIAGRFLDLGPWHIGFGIVQPLRKSEVLAVSLALSNGEDLETKRGNLHELFYPAELHGESIVLNALESMILALAMAVDMELIDADDLRARFGALFSGKTGGKGKRKAITT